MLRILLSVLVSGHAVHRLTVCQARSSIVVSSVLAVSTPRRSPAFTCPACAAWQTTGCTPNSPRSAWRCATMWCTATRRRSLFGAVGTVPQQRAVNGALAVPAALAGGTTAAAVIGAALVGELRYGSRSMCAGVGRSRGARTRRTPGRVLQPSSLAHREPCGVDRAAHGMHARRDSCAACRDAGKGRICARPRLRSALTSPAPQFVYCACRKAGRARRTVREIGGTVWTSDGAPVCIHGVRRPAALHRIRPDGLVRIASDRR